MEKQTKADTNAKKMRGGVIIKLAPILAAVVLICSAIFIWRIVNEKDFFTLCESGSAAEVERAVGRGTDINKKDEQGWSGLMYAAAYNSSPEVTRLLIEKGSDVNEKDGEGWSPLLLAARNNGSVEVLKSLIAGKADVKAVNREGRTALMSAISHYDAPDALRILLNAGLNADEVMPDGKTALMLAAYYGYPGDVGVLLEAGANPQKQDVYGHTALEIAAANNERHDVLRLLLKSGAKVTPAVMAAAQNNSRVWRSDIFQEMEDIYLNKRKAEDNPGGGEPASGGNNSAEVQEPAPLDKPITVSSNGRTVITAYQKIDGGKLRVFFKHEYSGNEARKILDAAVRSKKLDGGAAAKIRVNKFAYEYSKDGTAFARLFDDYYDETGELMFSSGSDPNKNEPVNAKKISGMGYAKVKNL